MIMVLVLVTTVVNRQVRTSTREYNIYEDDRGNNRNKKLAMVIVI